MPDFVDNTAGYSEVTGTADYLMTTTGTGLHLRLDQALVDGQEVAYYCVPSESGAAAVDAFESGVGTWDEDANTLVVDSVTNSSNGGGKISWSEGVRTLYIVSNAQMLRDINQIVESSTKKVMTAAERTSIASSAATVSSLGGAAFLDVGDTPGTVASGDSIDLDGLAIASPFDGTEKMISLQGGLLKYITPDQVIADHLTLAQGFDRGRLKSFSQFMNTAPAFVATDGALFGLEPFVCHLANGGVVKQDIATWFTSFGVAALSTGTNAAGRAGITSTMLPVIPSTAATYYGYFGAYCGLTAVPAGAQACYIGWITTPGAAAPTDGLYFMASGASPNWRAVSRRTNVETNTDTGIPIAASSPFVRNEATLEIVYEADAGETVFYINRIPVHTQPNDTNFPSPGAYSTYVFGAYIHNLGATTDIGLVVDAMSLGYSTDEPYLSTGML